MIDTIKTVLRNWVFTVVKKRKNGTKGKEANDYVIPHTFCYLVG